MSRGLSTDTCTGMLVHIQPLGRRTRLPRFRRHCFVDPDMGEPGEEGGKSEVARGGVERSNKGPKIKVVPVNR